MSRDPRLKEHTALLMPAMPGMISAVQSATGISERFCSQLPSFTSVKNYLEHADRDGQKEFIIDAFQKAYYLFVMASVIRVYDKKDGNGLLFIYDQDLWNIVSFISAMSTIPRLYRETYYEGKPTTAKQAIFWSTLLYSPFVLLSTTLISTIISTQYAIRDGFQKNLLDSSTLVNTPATFAETLAYAGSMFICAATQWYVHHENNKNRNEQEDSDLLKNLQRYIARDTAFGTVRDLACALGAVVSALSMFVLAEAFAAASMILYGVSTLMNVSQLALMLYQKTCAEKIDLSDRSSDLKSLDKIPENYRGLAELSSMWKAAEPSVTEQSKPTSQLPLIN